MSTTTEASRATSVVSNLPGSRNPNFVGRQDLLGLLQRRFTADQVLPLVITGMSGLGKSATALEYAFSRQNLYDLIWFIRAETPASMAVDMGRLAARLSPSATTPTDFQGNCRAVHRALRVRTRWLLIFDDAQSPQQIAPCLPWKCKGNVLITSRHADWSPVAESISLPPWRREDSIAFLQRNIPGLRDPIVSENLAKVLGDMPMALEQAVAYIKLAHIGPEDYLKAYEEQWAEMLVRGKPGAAYPSASAMAWELSFKQLKIDNPGAADLLTLCAFLGAEPISFSMIGDVWEQMPQSVATQFLDRTKLEQSAAMLQQLSLAQVWDKSLSVHCVTAALTRNRLSTDEKMIWAGAALTVAAGAFPFDSQDMSLWPQCAEALPHVLQAAAHAEKADISPTDIADLLDRAGWFLLKQAQFAHALQVLENAMKLVNDKIGPSTTMAARVANNLGRVRQRLGDFTGAMAAFESAMEIDSFRYGATTPYMASTANNFGMTLAATGQPQRARERFEFALKVFTTHYGDTHFKIASVLNNLGFVLTELKMPEEANSCYRRAIRIVESTQPNHPTLACIALNLGCLLRTQGHHEEAGQLLVRALRIDENKLGKNHPRIAHDLGKLAEYYDAQANRPLAIECLERASQILESNYGPDSAFLIPYLKELSKALKATSHRDRATELDARIVSIQSKKPTGDVDTGESVGFDDGVLSQ